MTYENIKHRHSSIAVLLAMITTAAWVNPVFAHHAMGGQTPQTFAQGLLSGIAHPVIGLDHLLFLVIVSLLCFAFSKPVRLLVPTAFIVAALAGTGMHLSGVNLPVVEIMVAISVILGGAVLLGKLKFDPALLASMIFGFGLFHGYAYGESIIGAEDSVLSAYLIGFSLVQYAIIVGIMMAMQKINDTSKQVLISRIAAISALLTGGALATMQLT